MFMIYLSFKIFQNVFIYKQKNKTYKITYKNMWASGYPTAGIKSVIVRDVSNLN